HSDLTSKCDLSETLWSTPPPQRCLHRRSVEDTWKRALDPGSTSETMRRTAPQNVRKSPGAVRRQGVRRWRQELIWCPSRPATAVLLCGLGFPQLPDHQAVRSQTPHKWEGNIRPKRSLCHALGKVAENPARLVVSGQAQTVAFPERCRR